LSHVIDILDHLLVDNFGITEKESSGFSLNTSLHQATLKIISPIKHRVTFNDFDLVAFLVAHK
jgi:hypothetical protein